MPDLAPTRAFADVAVGDDLTPLAIPLTRTVIVSTAIATRDYQDVHHDPALAVERGSPDIFMNILTTNGFVGRFVTEWAGPGSRISKLSIRLGAPNYPGGGANSARPAAAPPPRRPLPRAPRPVVAVLDTGLPLPGAVLR